MVADAYLNSVIRDTHIRKLINYELMTDAICGYSVAYRVTNTLGVNTGNFLFINLTPLKIVDTTFTHISEEEVVKHIQLPLENPLQASVEDFLQVIRDEKLKKGHADWRFLLGPFKCDFSRLSWSVYSTIATQKDRGILRFLYCDVTRREVFRKDGEWVN